MIKEILKDSKNFMFVFHRKANSLKEYQYTRRKWHNFRANHTSDRNIYWALEGDLGWIHDNKKMLIFFWHPSIWQPRLESITDITKLETENKLILLENLLTNLQDDPYLVLEIKSGLGSRIKAIECVMKLLNEYGYTNRVWFDTFSPICAREIKAMDREALVSLHTPIVMRNHMITANHIDGLYRILSSMHINNMNGLNDIDIITTFPRLNNRNTRRLVQSIDQKGKCTILSGLVHQNLFKQVWRSGSSGGYVRFDLDELGEI